jgi:TonB-dependent starch-binding outer membrane protein SusC
MFTADYYRKKTTDLLLNVPIPASVGTPGNTALQNAGSIENKGFEFQITSRNIVKSDFTWTTDLNFYVNRGKVLDIVGTTIQTGAINPAGSTYNLAYVKAGLPLGSFYGFISEGVDPQTGNIIFKDINGDSIVDDNDRTVIGNANPKFSYGITNTLTYKNFSLDIFFQGVQGNDIFNATRILSESMSLGMNQSASVLDRWKKEGDITDMPKSSLHDVSNSVISSRYIENGSYLRLKSITLGYNLPKSVLTKLRMSRCMIYVTSENLLTFTKYSGFDPEMSMFNTSSSSNTDKNTAPGVDYGTYPQSRDFLVGLNITF